MRVLIVSMVLLAAALPLAVIAAALWRSARWEAHVDDALWVASGVDGELDDLLDGLFPPHPGQPPRETLPPDPV